MGHDHDHEGGHAHGPPKYGMAFAIGISLNLAFVVVEVIYGLLSHSMALVADAGHNLSDVLGLALAWGATWLARKKPSKARTYGFRRATILAALANAVLLLVATGGVVWESVQRLSRPGVVEGKTVIVVALVGVFINGASALFFRSGKSDLNVRAAYLHLAADAVVSLGVVVTGVILLYTRWNLLDPIVSLLLSAVIVGSSWSLLRKSLNLALDAVPEGINVDEVRAYLEGLNGVLEVHDLHVWAMSTTENALTAHLVMAGTSCHPRFLGETCKFLSDDFGIEHATLQVEQPEAPDPCRLAPDETL
jgi:cobalt-zinc-cadmium efflux system protein